MIDPTENDPWAVCAEAGMLAVAQVEELEDAVPLANALVEGGIRAMELALRTPVSLEALSAMREAQPGLLIGAGTVLNPAQADAARAAGASFAVAPGLDGATVRHCRETRFPFAPGVATPSEIQSALALGCRVLKFFPAEFLGGVRGFRAINAPFAHLGARFIALGGIDEARAADYLAEPAVAAVGGSWIAPAGLIRQKAWGQIRENAAAAVALAAQRSGK